MIVKMLKKDGRCKWLGEKVLTGLFRDILKNSCDPCADKWFIIIDWMSNDNGKVGVDLNWLKGLGIPAVKSVADLPSGNGFSVINTGYDSIIHEEKILRERGINIIDLPCPWMRKVRIIFEKKDSKYQYVLLCEANHIMIKNFASIFPEDLILVQMSNYREKILQEQNGKPLKLVPHVTFLASHADEIFSFISSNFPNRENTAANTCCMWVKGSASPVEEIQTMDKQRLEGIQDALLIAPAGSLNKSVVSLVEAIEAKGLNVRVVSNLSEYMIYEKNHKNSTVLLVRSPIPNKAEKPIETYIEHGYIAALLVQFIADSHLKLLALMVYSKSVYCKNWLLVKIFSPSTK